jgi:hypothetical protein
MPLLRGSPALGLEPRRVTGRETTALREIAVAQHLIAVWTQEDPLSIGFECGFALGIGLPVTSLAFGSDGIQLAEAAGLKVAVAPTSGAIELSVDKDSPLIRAAERATPVNSRTAPENQETVLQALGEPFSSSAVDWSGAQCLVGPPSDELVGIVQDTQPSWDVVSLPEVLDHLGDIVEQLSGATSLVWAIPRATSGAESMAPTLSATSNLVLGTRAALALGSAYAALLLRNGAEGAPALRVLRHADIPPIACLVDRDTAYKATTELATILRQFGSGAHPSKRRYTIQRLELNNFKNFDHLLIDLTAESTLPGNWTCMAGINGAGKSSVLQALVIALLGPTRAAELGSARLRRYPRLSGGIAHPANIRVWVQDPDGIEREISMPLESSAGIDQRALINHPQFEEMDAVWSGMAGQLFLAYGATRNISDYRDSRYDTLDPLVRRHMTLFDPLSQIVNVDAILEGGSKLEATRSTLARVIEAILVPEGIELRSSSGSTGLKFEVSGNTLDIVDLPDGFRSVVAWLADLCLTWHAQAESDQIGEGDPKDISGIVLIDEIDLHLHASLQRTIVPRLREALPGVQWIVTTHSALVLSSFDAAELVLLDASLDDGVRSVDHQVMALSSDQVYETLLATEATSAALEARLATPDRDLELLVQQSLKTVEGDALATVVEKQRLLEELKAKRLR